MAIYKQETFVGLNGEQIVVTMYGSSTEMNVYSSNSELLEMGVNIVGEWPVVKDGLLHYATAYCSPDGTVEYVNDTLPYQIRPVISWK
jgi:hypothetical protein